MSDIPKKRQGMLDDLKKYLGMGDEEAVSDILRNQDPMAIRDNLSTALGQHVQENYDSPINTFKNKDILSEVPIKEANLPPNIAGKYVKSEKGIYLPQGSLENPTARTIGNQVHELGHADDILNKGFSPASALEEYSPKIAGTGLEAAEKAFGQHHEMGFFEKEALQKLLQGGKLAAGYIAPVVKGLGIAGLGLGALGAYNKAQAGDYAGAASDVADMTPTIGPIKQMVEPGKLGSYDTDTKNLKPYDFSNLKGKLNGR